jgi:hypothetical protein
MRQEITNAINSIKTRAIELGYAFPTDAEFDAMSNDQLTEFLLSLVDFVMQRS